MNGVGSGVLEIAGCDARCAHPLGATARFPSPSRAL